MVGSRYRSGRRKCRRIISTARTRRTKEERFVDILDTDQGVLRSTILINRDVIGVVFIDDDMVRTKYSGTVVDVQNDASIEMDAARGPASPTWVMRAEGENYNGQS